MNTVIIWGIKFMQQMDANVTVNCLHPGVVRTRLTRERDGFLTGLLEQYITLF